MHILEMRGHDMNPWSIWLGPWENYVDQWAKALGSDIHRLHSHHAAGNAAIKPGATPFHIVLEDESFALLDFSRDKGISNALPTLIVTPYALHDWRVADLAHHHSLVETLLSHGVSPLYVVAWKSANFKMRHNRIDTQFLALKKVTDVLAQPVQCVGLCQGGWLSLAFAARFPEYINRLALIGAPVDFSSCSKIMSAMDNTLIDASINWLSLAGGGVIRGWSTQSLWQIKFGEGSNKADALQETDARLSSDKKLLKIFEDWDCDVLDLPPAYFGEVLKHLYRDNEIMTGQFRVLDEYVSLRSITCPILIMTGCDDDVAPKERIQSIQDCVSTDRNKITILEAECGHLALFLGRNTLHEQWPEIAHWLTTPSLTRRAN